LIFADGSEGVVDLSGYAGKGVFASWLEKGIFECVSITSAGAVEWPGGIDLCPDALYLRMTGRSPMDLFPSIRSRLVHA
jgi:hypothetical protein